MSGSSQMKPSRSFPALTRAWTTRLPMIHAVSWYIRLSCSVYLHYCLSPVEIWLGDLCLNITHFSSSIHSLTHFIQQAYFKQSLYMHNKKEIKRKGWLKHGPGAQPSHFMGAQTHEQVIIAQVLSTQSVGLFSRSSCIPWVIPLCLMSLNTICVLMYISGLGFSSEF